MSVAGRGRIRGLDCQGDSCGRAAAAASLPVKHSKPPACQPALPCPLSCLHWQQANPAHLGLFLAQAGQAVGQRLLVGHRLGAQRLHLACQRLQRLQEGVTWRVGFLGKATS